MRGEISWDIQSRRDEVVSQNKQEVRRPEVSKILKIIKEKGIKEIDGRLKTEFTRLGLLSNNSLTEEGIRAIEKETVLMPEYGQYEFVTVSDGDPWLSNRLLALRRVSGGKQKDSSQDEWERDERRYEDEMILDRDLADIDASKGVVLLKSARTGSRLPSNTRYFTMNGKIDYDASDPKKKCDITGHIEWVNERSDVKKENPIERPIDIDFDELLEDTILDFDSKKRSIILDSEPKDDEELKKMRKDIKSEGDYRGHTVRYDFKDVPLQARNEECARSWISRLRKLMWKDSFIPEEQCLGDQEEWKKRIYPSGRFEPLEGEKLLNEIENDPKVYWNVASMMDLVPKDSRIRCAFYAHKNEEVTEKFKKNIFTEDILRSIKEVYVIDNYAPVTLPEIIRNLIPQSVRIILMSDPKKYNKQDNRKIDPWNPPNGVVHKKLEGTHARHMIIKDSENNIHCWTLDNSFDHFYLKRDVLYSDDNIQISPVTDTKRLEELKKITAGDK